MSDEDTPRPPDRPPVPAAASKQAAKDASAARDEQTDGMPAAPLSEETEPTGFTAPQGEEQGVTSATSSAALAHPRSEALQPEPRRGAAVSANAPDIVREPYRFDVFNVLRDAERRSAALPRIGDSARRREDAITLGQDPFVAFPACNVNRATLASDGRLNVFVRFLGLLGPQGALPLTLTEEVYHWHLSHDEAFARFLDIFNHRFLQLFFRAWADARPISQHDRPDADRFHDYLASLIGIGTDRFRNLDTVPDIGKLAFAGLLSPRVKSASRLSDFLAAFFGVKVEIDEFLPTLLPLDPTERTRLGETNSGIGVDLIIGAAVLSFQDRFRIRIYTETLKQYESFLPKGTMAQKLADAVRFYIGDELEWDVELALPRRLAPAAQLGTSGRLGWTGWMSPDRAPSDDPYRKDARFRPPTAVTREAAHT